MTSTESPPTTPTITRTILKPGETDRNYLCELTRGGQWRYLLARDHVIRGCRVGTEAWKREFAHFQIPLGQYRPLPQARRFHKDTSRFRFCTGGNRSSKSQSLAVETIWRATGTHPFQKVKIPSIGWYATTTSEKITDTLWDKLNPEKGGLLTGIRHEIAWRSRAWNIPGCIRIPVPGGTSEIYFKAYEQGRESFQAAEIDYAHFDEQCPEDVFVETISRIGSGRQMMFAQAMTPLESQPWLETRLTVDTRESDAVFAYPLDDNRESYGGFISDREIDALVESWAPEVRDTRRLGKWASFRGAIFNMDRALHVVPEAKEKLFFVPDRTMPVSYGAIDWGGANPFVFLWAAKIPHLDNDWYVFDELYWDHRKYGGRRLEQLAQDIKDRTARWNTSLWRVWADHDPTDARELMHYGVPSVPAAKIGAADEIGKAGIEQIQMALKARPHLSNPDWPDGRPGLHIAARCTNLIREMTLYRWTDVPDYNTRSPRNVPAKVNDHAVDALRYVMFNERKYANAAGVIDIGHYPRTFR